MVVGKLLNSCGRAQGGKSATAEGLYHAAPTDIATCMYYTAIDSFTKQEVFVAHHLRDHKLLALMQFFKPENWFTVREALIQARR